MLGSKVTHTCSKYKGYWYPYSVPMAILISLAPNAGILGELPIRVKLILAGTNLFSRTPNTPILTISDDILPII